MTPKQALDSLLQTDLNYDHVKEEAALLAVLRRDWAVRVLDAWAAPASGRQYHISPDGVFLVQMKFARAGKCDTFPNVSGIHAARAAAADVLWPELHKSVRAEIGEKP